MTEPTFDSDRIGNFPHPRESSRLVGHAAAERTLLQAIASGRLAHAWLFAGPQGIGKATLAYRFARFLLRFGAPVGEPRPSLDVDPDDPVSRRVAALSHGNLLVLRRPWKPGEKKPKTVVTVGEVRRVQNFFALAAGEEGWRVCIIDCADDMNLSAANALLKTLEEPPGKSVLIAVSHAPGRLLPTIRSRCRRLNLKPLSDDEVRLVLRLSAPRLKAKTLDRLVPLAGGSPGKALQLAELDGVALYDEIAGLLAELPALRERAIFRLGDRLARPGVDRSYLVALDLLADQVRALALERLAENGRDAAGRWAEAWEDLQRLMNVADGLNLGPKQTLYQAFCRLEEAARE